MQPGIEQPLYKYKFEGNHHDKTIKRNQHARVHPGTI